MHKGIYAGLLGTVILFSACGYKTKNSVKESSAAISTTEVGSTKSTSTTSITNTSTGNVDSQHSQSSIQSFSISSTSEMQESTVPSLPLENSDKALLFLIAHRSELQSDDIVISFYQKLIEIICSQLPANKSVPKEDLEALVLSSVTRRIDYDDRCKWNTILIR